MAKNILKIIGIIIRIILITVIIGFVIIGLWIFSESYKFMTPEINTNLNNSESEILQEEFMIELNDNERIFETIILGHESFSIQIENIDDIQNFISNSLKLDIKDVNTKIETLKSNYDNMINIKKRNLQNCIDNGIEFYKDTDDIYSERIVIYLYNDKIYALIQKEELTNSLSYEIFKKGEKDYGWLSFLYKD